ncbi:MAG: hypothetical protein LUE87_09860 [Lachnospiraceae bacterium]|nr:hypothetical protein [Lachnospiraceae bacterium]
MDFLWIICIFLLAANQNCGCGCIDGCGCTDSNSLNRGADLNRGANVSRAATGSCGVNAVSGDCCCGSDNAAVPDDCSCEVPQPLMPGNNGNTRTAQYPFPPYPVLRG